MTKTSMLALFLVAAAVGSAHAGGQNGSIGAGAEYELNGIGGASVNYDAGQFHVGGFMAMADPQGRVPVTFAMGARFFYHVHSTAMADFGVGGGLGLQSDPVPSMTMPNTFDRNTNVYLEPSIQIRLFVASNVALSFTAGMIIGTIDAGGVEITGQPQGIAGVHYYFF